MFSIIDQCLQTTLNKHVNGSLFQVDNLFKKVMSYGYKLWLPSWLSSQHTVGYRINTARIYLRTLYLQELYCSSCFQQIDECVSVPCV